MKISVIIPTYNRADYVLYALNSVKCQSCRVDEIIVIDDGSIDGTDILLQNKGIKYIYQEQKGVSAARNRGLKEAKYPWIAFLDSDDTWQSNKIAIQKEFHSKNPEFLASFTDELWIRDGKAIGQKKHQRKEQPTFINSLRSCKIGASSFFAHKSLFESVGYFDESLYVCEDYDLWLRILLDNQIKYIDQKLITKYAGHSGQLSFETPLIDRFRIEALCKHINCDYKNEVLAELIYKIELLLKGAKKHNNKELIDFCEEKRAKINSPDNY